MDKKSRDIFYGVVLVATLIVALVGSTLAYFSYRTSSEEDAVKAVATIVNIRYEDGNQVTAQADKLIPATLDVVKNVYQTHVVDGNSIPSSENNICLDSENYQVCSIYRFSVSSDYARDVYAMLDTEDNEFTYLAYAVRDVTNNTWIILDNRNGKKSESIKLAKCSNKNADPSDDCFYGSGETKTYNTNPLAINSIFGYNNDSSLKTNNIVETEHIYDLVLFIDENTKNQNVDQGKKYQGTIVVEVTNDIDAIISGKK